MCSSAAKLVRAVPRRLKWVWCLLPLIVLFTGCSRVAPVVKVGLVGPFEGRYRARGYDVIYSARLAVREINAAGGVEGTRIALVALDDSGDPGLARQTAASLVVDANVVAVIGHWLPETTAAAEPVYREAGLPFINPAEAPFRTTDPATLPSDFLDAYAAVTPFDEVAGAYAGAAYDAFQLLWLALEEAASGGDISRAAVSRALVGLQLEGMSGLVYIENGD
ncbi:MAG: ABC transporter substrate-binding protein [Anaerolineae bacterium]